MMRARWMAVVVAGVGLGLGGWRAVRVGPAWADCNRSCAESERDDKGCCPAKPAPKPASSTAPKPATSTAPRTSSSTSRTLTSPTVGVLKWIPAGTFQMGSPSGVGEDSEHPQHSVTLSRGFWLMEHEVTQGEWSSVMGRNPSRFSSCGSDCPVEQVSWDDAVEFARRVSAQEGVEYRLPTEAEWEYAARGGQGYTYAGSENLDGVGWYSGNSGSTTHPVCQKQRNGFGLCDMTGNVWEWVSDWSGSYPSGAMRDPMGASSGATRVYRGGSWLDAAFSRVADRLGSDPGNRGSNLGFRLARSVP